MTRLDAFSTLPIINHNIMRFIKGKDDSQLSVSFFGVTFLLPMLFTTIYPSKYPSISPSNHPSITPTLNQRIIQHN